MSYIYIQPFGQIDGNILEAVGKAVEQTFGLPYKIREPMELPINAFFRRRRQWHSTTILERALNINIQKDAIRILGICDVDLYVEALNFVFGEADTAQGTALISIFRLRPEYYRLPKNDKLFTERVGKEAIHELGHTFGLHHCDNNKCIMFFSNTLSDTDGKGPGFCERCAKILKDHMRQ